MKSIPQPIEAVPHGSNLKVLDRPYSPLSPHQAIVAVAWKVKWGTEVKIIQHTVLITGICYCLAAVEEKTLR